MQIHQMGAGGVGFWLTPSLLRAGQKVIVYDDDNFLGGKGHMRLPRPSNPETLKVDLLRGFCLASMGDEGITVVRSRFTGDEVEAGDLVVDCTDMALNVRRGVWAKAKELGARCLRVSYDGKNHTVVVAEGLPLVGRKGGGYTDVPGMGLSFVAGGIGAIVVEDVLKGNLPGYIDFHISIADFLVSARSADFRIEQVAPCNEGTLSVIVSADQIALGNLLQDAIDGEAEHTRKVA